jgi:anti-sigma-K factor RskA
MRRNANRQIRKAASGATDAIKEYLAHLYDVYPPARGNTRISARSDNQVIVNVPLPTRARERMQLFDRMAEVGTRLLLETGEYIILTGR